MDRRTLFHAVARPERNPRLSLALAPVGLGTAPVWLTPSRPAVTETVQFRLTGASEQPFWLPDGMGGGVDPEQPPMDRRELLVRVAVAGVGLAVGGAINALSMVLARQSLDGRVPEPSADARH